MIADVEHPDLLNPWQTYRQAKQLLKHTSRASQPEWYREAIEIERQWHVWIDGGVCVSAVFSQKTGEWSEGPALPVPTEKNEAGDPDYTVDERRALHETLNRILVDKSLGGKAKALGFVLHVANEFDVADLSPEFAADDDFKEVSELLAVAPGDALGDHTLEGDTYTRQLREAR